MSNSRYFINKFSDYIPGSKVTIDPQLWVKNIKRGIDKVVRQMPPKPENCDGHLYVGCAGIGYMLYYASQCSHFADVKDEYLREAKTYTRVSLAYSTSCQDPPSAFLLGAAGVQALGALVFSTAPDSEREKQDCVQGFVSTVVKCEEPLDYLRCGSDELLVGRAGCISGALLLNRTLGEVVPNYILHKLCSAIIKSGTQYSKKRRSSSPLMFAYYKTEYLGAAHGLSGILQMLLSVPDFVKSDGETETIVRAAVDFMLKLQQPNGNIAPAMDEVGVGRQRPESEELVHWCHGAPGVVYLFAKAYLVWKDEKYLQACLKCGDLTWQKGLLKKGPGICHGVAGSGYVFLLLYRLTSDQKHLHRALKFAEFLFSEEFLSGARRPDSPFSLYEGWAGAWCFCVDLLQPEKAEFPFFDVFSNNT